MPWWLVLLIVGGMFVYNFFLCDDSIFKIEFSSSRPKKDKKRDEKEKEQQKTAATKNNASINTGGYQTNTYQGYTTSHYRNDNLDYERYRAQAEEQAAYDDFIASLDMDD